MTTASAPTAAAMQNPRAVPGVDPISQAPERSVSGAGRATDSSSDRKAVAGGNRAERVAQNPDVLAPAWASGAQLIDTSFDSSGVVASLEADAADPEQLNTMLDEAGTPDQMIMVEQAPDADQMLGDAADVIEFNAGHGVLDPALQRSLRVEFAQAPSATASDATAGGGILSMPPYQLVIGGLALGLVAGGGAGGGGSSGGSEFFAWGVGNLNITTPGGTTVTVDAGGGASGRSLILNGGSAVNVNGFSGSNLINAANLTGNLSVNIVDDGNPGRLVLTTGSGATTVTSYDARDELVIDAAALASSSALALGGQVSDAKVSGLAGGLNASALSAGSLSVSTAALAAGQQRSLAISTGAGATSVSGVQGDTIIIDAEALPDEVTLKTSGGANFQISNLMGNLDNTATGSVTATLDHDPNPGVELRTTIKSTTAVTVNNGALDTNDTIVLEGAGAFTVKGLLATLDASRVAGSTNVTAAIVAAPNEIKVIPGATGATVAGTAAGSRIAVDASNIPDGTALQLRGPGSFNVTGLKGDVVADEAQGNVSVSTADLDAQSVSVKLGAAGGQIRAVSTTDTINVDALAMKGTSTLMIGGAGFAGNSIGTVTVTGLRGTLENRGTGKTDVTLAAAADGSPATASVMSDNIIVVNNGNFAATDTIKLSGSGEFGLKGVAANVDGTGVTGVLSKISATLNTNSGVTIKLSPSGSDTLVLNGRDSSATLLNVETIDVSSGGDISKAAISSGAGPATAGRISGTQLDFADQTTRLVVSPAQHADMQQGGLVKALQADSGTQTLSLSSGGTIAQTIPHIDVYELSSAGQLLPITIKTQALSVTNDIQQQLTLATNQPSPALTIKGSSGADVIRTAAVDVVRGGLVVDLAGDTAVDYVFVKNIEIGNSSSTGNAVNGFGGGLVASTGGEFANYPTLAGTVANHWSNLKLQADASEVGVSGGVRAATVFGFAADGPTADKVVYLNSESSVAKSGYFTISQANPAGFAPTDNAIIEIESGYITALSLTNAAAANVGKDPRALDKVATVLATLPPFLDSAGDQFYVVLYDYSALAPGQKADAWLYAAVSTQDDGLDFAENATVIERDTDTLELIAIFKGVGVNAFTTDNFL